MDWNIQKISKLNLGIDNHLLGLGDSIKYFWWTEVNIIDTLKVDKVAVFFCYVIRFLASVDVKNLITFPINDMNLITFPTE
jgi:hypothetical protein